jgi:GNAT superfamily N-acetyltransferase
LIGEAAGKIRVAVSAIGPVGEDLDARNRTFREAGWRLTATEGFFVHDLKKLPQAGDPRVRRVQEATDVARFAKACKRKPASLGVADVEDAPVRLYEASGRGTTVGWVYSVKAGRDAWVSNLHVLPAHRRKGLGAALMAALLADDARLGRRRSVLLASHSGALLYPTLGYRRIGTLMLLVRTKR